jgi:DNA-binding FadR family transcriptional regulator
MTTEHDPIKRRKLSDEVQQRLLAIIETDRLGPGDALPSERDLMTAFGVGRPAIREAMQSLERMGLVEIRHGERARIAEPSFGRMVEQMSESMRHILSHSPASLAHLKEARATFEMEMARIAAQRAKPADVARLRRTIDAQEAQSQNSPAFLQLDARFHREIAAISGNPIFASLSEALLRWLQSFHVGLMRVPGLEKLTLAEHRQIVDEIEAGNVAGAAKAMSDHLYRANDLYHQDHFARSGEA